MTDDTHSSYRNCDVGGHELPALGSFYLQRRSTIVHDDHVVADWDATAFAVRQAPHVAIARQGDRTILFCLKRNRYLGLDGLGSYIWSCLEQRQSPRQILSRLVSEFETEKVTRKELSSDLGHFLSDLITWGALIPAGERVKDHGKERVALHVTDQVAATASASVRDSAEVRLTTTLGLLGLMYFLVRTVGLYATLRMVTKWNLGGRHIARKSVIRYPIDTLGIAVALFPGKADCLEQSLVLFVLLRRRGYPSSLCFGCTPYPFAAHAWLECEGVPISESSEFLQRFARFSLPTTDCPGNQRIVDAGLFG